MANYKVVDADQLDADLTVVADAIREKGGTSEQLAFPNGMVDAIMGIVSDGGGIGAIKFIDVDITVDASTNTVATYSVDDLEFATTHENPTRYDAFNKNDVYLAFITPKEIGEPTGEEINIFRSYIGLGSGSTNYANLSNNIACGTNVLTTQAYGVYGVTLTCTTIQDGKPIGNMAVKVRHHTTSGYNVLAGVYNVKVFLLTDFDWGFN